MRGEVRVKSYTQDPAAIGDYSPLQSRDGRLYTIQSLRPAGEVLIARVAELTDRDAAEAVTNLQLFVPATASRPRMARTSSSMPTSSASGSRPPPARPSAP